LWMVCIRCGGFENRVMHFLSTCAGPAHLAFACGLCRLFLFPTQSVLLLLLWCSLLNRTCGCCGQPLSRTMQLAWPTCPS
jgi:hypothetical protein